MSQAPNQQTPTRVADTLVQTSEQRIGAMALISHTQVKLWKAMLAGLFIAGFVAAIAFVAGFTQAEKASQLSSLEFSSTEASQRSVKRDARSKITIRRISPVSGPVETPVVLAGTGLTGTGTVIHFGNGIVLSSSTSVDKDGEGILIFTVPKYLLPECVYDTPPCDVAPPLPIQPGDYRVWVSNANGKSNEVVFTVTPQKESLRIEQAVPPSGPVGTSVTLRGDGFSLVTNEIKFGPGVLKQLIASPDGTTLTFLVPESVFSRTVPCLSPAPCPLDGLAKPIPVTPGEYRVSVLNEYGESNAVKFKVVAGKIVNVSIERMDPTSGPVGTKVILDGTGFTPTSNTVFFGEGVIRDLPANIGTTGGIIEFIVPGTLPPPECDLYLKALPSSKDPMIAPLPCPLPSIPISLSERYPVSVMNVNGKSNQVMFTVVSSIAE